MPNPADYSSEQEFVSACIPVRIKEGDTPDQAAGACYGIWRNAKKAAVVKGLNDICEKLEAMDKARED
jgi:hypothetical protein